MRSVLAVPVTVSALAVPIKRKEASADTFKVALAAGEVDVPVQL
jgi:hypothetical protein